jgi:hypothetical protein
LRDGASRQELIPCFVHGVAVGKKGDKLREILRGTGGPVEATSKGMSRASFALLLSHNFIIQADFEFWV